MTINEFRIQLTEIAKYSNSLNEFLENIAITINDDKELSEQFTGIDVSKDGSIVMIGFETETILIKLPQFKQSHKI